MNIQLNTWAANTAEAYDRIARTHGDDAPAFYTQSDLTKITDSPRVFVMGINPGSGGTYKEQCDSEYWQLGGKPMDGTHLLKGNPSWSNRSDWAYWQRIYRLFDANPHPLDNETDFIVTNATFFATPKARNLLPQLLAETLPYTLELIEITRPQMIVILSGNALLKTIKAHCDATGRRLQYSQTFASLGNIFTGHLEGIPCCGIPHPSACLFREEHELMKKVVTQTYRCENITADTCQDLLHSIRQRRNAKGLSKEEMATLFELLIARMQSLPYPVYESCAKKFSRYDLCNGLQLTIANNSTTHCIAIRPKNYKREKDIDQIPMPHVRELLECFDKVNYANTPVWLGVKDFNTLTLENNVEGLADSLVEEIKELISEVCQILPPSL